jgi:hypothetical protein
MSVFSIDKIADEKEAAATKRLRCQHRNENSRRIIMKRRIARSMFLAACLALVFTVLVAPLHAEASQCSTAASAGKWAYTYTGTIFTSNGPLPSAAVGHFSADAEGNLFGSQTRSVAGSSGVEDIVGTFSVNRDCTGTATINVFVNGQLQRTAVLAVAYDNNMNHARGIFQSVVLPDGTNVPVVITSDNTRLAPRH